MNILTVSPAARGLSRRFLHPVVLSLCAVALLGGCATTRDAKSRSNIADLKKTHLAFIDEFTEGAGKTWDDQKLTAQIAAMETQFSQAEQYEATKGKDKLRSNAISNIHAQFKRDAGALQRRKAFYRAKFAAHLKDQVSQNYDQALRGEDARS
jgi:hypothetical protein